MALKVIEFTVKVLFDDGETEGGSIHDVLTDAVVNEAGWDDGVVHVTWTDSAERDYITDEFAAEDWPDSRLLDENDQEFQEALFGNLDAEDFAELLDSGADVDEALLADEDLEELLAGLGA